MEKADLYEAIFKRKSVRKFDPAPLDAETLAKITAFLGEVKPMFPDIKTELKVLPGTEVKSGLLKARVPHFIAAFSEKKDGYLTNVGFMLQQVDLFLSANGIGSLWQGNPTPSNKAAGGSKLDFVIMLAFGRPAEPVHRTSVSEFKRKPLEKISTASGYEELLEPARLAPSAMNGQPWFFIGDEGAIHVYCDRSAMFYIWNKVGVGAAVCHAWVAAAHHGKGIEFVQDKKGRDKEPKKNAYVITLRTLSKGSAQLLNATEPDVSYSFEVQVNDPLVR